MTKLTIRCAVGAGIVMGVAVALAGQAFDAHEAHALDRLFVMRGAIRLERPITIVEIDDSTFAALKVHWPFPRRTHGEVLERLSAAGTIAIGLDLVFSTPSVHGLADDEAFGASVRRARGVVLAAVVTSVTEGFYTKVDANLPLPVLRQGAAIGQINQLVDDDGRMRRALLVSAAPVPLPMLTVELHRIAATNGIAAAAIPPQPRVWINVAGPAGTFPRLSYARVLHGQFPPELVRGRIVLIGGTSPLLHDTSPTSYGQMPGVELLANILHTLLTGRRIREGIPPWARALIAGVCAALGAMLVGLSGLRGPGLVGLMWVALVGAAYVVFAKADIWLPMVAPTVALLFGAVVRLLFRR